MAAELLSAVLFFQTKLLNLFSFVWNTLLNIQILKLWPQRNRTLDLGYKDLK